MLTTGARLGPYEIQTRIGSGGMGEVYRATDTNLKRAVAIKVLPASVATDRDRLARFQREAEVLASLNHPNIAAVYGLERSTATSALVMELVEGPTLADRIAQGPIPVDEALPIAKQIAEALEAAHERGIIHRDLKPANIKMRPDGTVKVLDFGLAKALEPMAARADATASPTITSPAMMTGIGVLLGTAAYMSPEQARGQQAGPQSDIWAFGVVLYEMLTGRQPFTGDTVTDVLAGVVRSDPDWTLLPNTVLMLVRHCLQKNRRDRLHHIGDARIAITAAESNASWLAVERQKPTTHRRRRLAWIGATLLVAMFIATGAAAYVAGYLGAASQDVGSIRFNVAPPADSTFGIGATAPYISLSPDGRTLAFIASRNGVNQVWLRSLDSLEALPLKGTEGVSTAASPAPFWSPDSRFIGFFAQGKLKKIAVAGGPAQTLCDAEGASGTWNRAGVILFDGGGAGGPLQRVDAGGGTPEPVTTLDQARGDQRHLYPHFLPDGDHFLFLARGADIENQAIMVGSLGSPDSSLVIRANSRAIYDAQQYDVSADGQRFIVSRPVDEAREAPITIVTHWTATLKE